MLKTFKRKNKISQEIKKKISIIFQKKIKDPRIKFITISKIDISKDFSHAKVFVTFLGFFNKKNKEKNIKNYIKILNGKMSQYIRLILKKTIYLKFIPLLTFYYDQSYAKKINLVDLIHNKNQKKF